MEHSKLPWRIDKENKCIASADDTAILKYRHSIGPKQLANAEFIVLAVNAHKDLTQQRYDLLAACTKAHDALLALHVCKQDRSFADEIRTLLRDAIAAAS